MYGANHGDVSTSDSFETTGRCGKSSRGRTGVQSCDDQARRVLLVDSTVVFHRSPTRFFLLSLALGLALPAAAKSLYVRASGTDLKATASPGGASVAKLPIGSKVEVVAKEGNWVKVTVTVEKAEKSGFVFAAKLSDDKPDKERFGGDSVAVGAHEGDTAMALRGLSATSEKYAERSDIRAEHVEAITKMEKRKPPASELESFLREGKLGEYVQ